MLDPLGCIPICNHDPVWLLAVTLLDAATVRLTLRREQTYILTTRGKGEPVWIPLTEKRPSHKINQMEQQTRTYIRDVTALGWAAIRRELVRVE